MIADRYTIAERSDKPLSNVTIINIEADQILDSRGWPTLHVEVTLNAGHHGIAESPSGTSTGSFEAMELRDGERPYGGRGVKRAIALIHEIVRPALLGQDPRDQQRIDNWMIAQDAILQKSRWGSNTMLGVSLAIARASAAAQNIPLYRYWNPKGPWELPTPQLNVINGGLHADNSLPIQEFLLISGGATTFADALQMGTETYHALKYRLMNKGYRTAVGDEGGFAPEIETPEEIFEMLLASIEDAGYAPGRDIALGIDVAANGMRRDTKYLWQRQSVTSQQLITTYHSWIQQYPLVSIEDGLAEDDWDGWQELTRSIGQQCQVVGDDIFVTDQRRVEQGIDSGAANAALVKLNQMGTVTETLAFMQSLQRARWNMVVSHRSGETCDTSLADLAVAMSAGQVKAGAPQHGERLVKYNRLLLVESRDPALHFAGWQWRPGFPYA